jgi:hypothetical protein
VGLYRWVNADRNNGISKMGRLPRLFIRLNPRTSMISVRF